MISLKELTETGEAFGREEQLFSAYGALVSQLRVELHRALKDLYMSRAEIDRLRKKMKTMRPAIVFHNQEKKSKQ